MALGKFLEIAADGSTSEAQAIQTSAGAGDSDKIPRTDSTGKIDQSFMPVGIGPDIKSLVASEDLDGGDLVNVWDDAGTEKARKADASAAAAGKRAHGFVLSAATLGNPAVVYFEGVNDQLTGLTRGAQYFLSDTAGQATTTVQTTSGYTHQDVGVAISATEISFEPTKPVIRV